MSAVDRLADCIGGELAAMLLREQNCISELRLRCDRQSRLCRMDGTEAVGPALEKDMLRATIITVAHKVYLDKYCAALHAEETQA